MIICVNCGQVNETAASRCLRCGASVFELPSYLGQPDSPPKAPVPSPPPKAPPYTPLRPTPTMDPFPTPPPVTRPVYLHYPPVTGGFVCPYCQTNLPPRLISRVSTAGWITLVVLLLFCWPLFWIGFLIREERCVCRVCGGRLG
ncbi:MAG: hypothetical protein NZ585_03115 [Chloracidobacterium sp.]|nr:hypothetical protein [Chloracidobacterium sp.]MDW8217264.1 hypothetical protein [Acidobacteriota bacterium]